MAKQIESTKTLMERTLVLYRRERSNVWQCRYKVDGKWQRATTKQHDEAKAREVAKRLMIEAEIRLRENLPVITRKFRNVAKLAVERMETETEQGRGKGSYADYIRIIENYLIPCFKNKNITSIDITELNELEKFRNKKLGKIATHSTVLTHNAALNRVFDEAELRGVITKANRPKLIAQGQETVRRPAFALEEIREVLGNFDEWIAHSRGGTTVDFKLLLKDYVDVLFDTGARPGKELMNLQWAQVKFNMKPTVTQTGEFEEVDGEVEEIVQGNLNRSCELVVSGKTGRRTILGMNRTVKALSRLAVRNYGVEVSLTKPFGDVANLRNNDYVFRTKDKSEPTSFQRLFQSYLDDYDLLTDPITKQNRVFYSLRHTYATLALTHDSVPIHTLAKQMGTSVVMIERHYSHLQVPKAIEQLRNAQTSLLVNMGNVLEEKYKLTRKSRAFIKKEDKAK